MLLLPVVLLVMKLLLQLLPLQNEVVVIVFAVVVVVVCGCQDVRHFSSLCCTRVRNTLDVEPLLSTRNGGRR